MLSRFRALLTATERSNTESALEYVPPPRSQACQPPFCPELIERLRATHLRLTGEFQLVLDSHRQGDFEACLHRVRKFDRDLREYLVYDSGQFQAYMGSRLDGDFERLLLMRRVRARLRQLAREVREVSLPFGPGGLSPAQSPDFGLAFSNMAKTLRVSLDVLELQLFPLYLLPPAVTDPEHSGEISGRTELPLVARR